MSTILFKRLDKAIAIFGRITEELETKELLSGKRPMSIVFGHTTNIVENMTSVVSSTSSLTDEDDILNTKINTLPVSIAIQGTLYRATGGTEIAEQSLSDLRDGRAPVSALKGPSFQRNVLKKWASTNQLLTFTSTDIYKHLVIEKMTINEAVTTGVGEYDVSLIMTRVKKTLKKDLEKVSYDSFFYNKEPTEAPRSGEIGTTKIDTAGTGIGQGIG